MKVKELIGLLRMCQPEEEVRLMLVQGSYVAVGPVRSSMVKIGGDVVLSNQDADKWMERRRA